MIVSPKSVTMLVIMAVAAIVPASAQVTDDWGEPPTTIGTPEQAAFSCQISRQYSYPTGIEVECSDPDKPCGLYPQPDCWIVRFACWAVGGPVEYATDGLVKCGTQPGCCEILSQRPDEEEAESGVAMVDETLVSVAGNCDNYGIVVHLVITPDVCRGESCNNYGIRVIIAVFGSYCNRGPVSVCVSSVCVEVCRASCTVAEWATERIRPVLT